MKPIDFHKMQTAVKCGYCKIDSVTGDNLAIIFCNHPNQYFQRNFILSGKDFCTEGDWLVCSLNK